MSIKDWFYVCFQRRMKNEILNLKNIISHILKGAYNNIS